MSCGGTYVGPELRFSIDSGSTFKSASTDYSVAFAGVYYGQTSNTINTTADSLASEVSWLGVDMYDTTDIASVEITLFEPGDTTQRAHGIFHGHCMNDSNGGSNLNRTTMYSGGFHFVNFSDAVDQVRFGDFNSANNFSGKYMVVGW